MDISDFSLWTEEAKRAYAAGIIDGEGSISIRRYFQRGQTKASIHLCVSVKMSLKGQIVLEFLRVNFGAKVWRPRIVKGAGPDWQPCRDAMWWSQKALDFLEKVRPYLILKARQADVAIRFQTMMRDKARLPKNHWSEGVRFKAEELYKQMRVLNARGTKALEVQSSTVKKTGEVSQAKFDF